MGLPFGRPAHSLESSAQPGQGCRPIRTTTTSVMTRFDSSVRFMRRSLFIGQCAPRSPYIQRERADVNPLCISPSKTGATQISCVSAFRRTGSPDKTRQRAPDPRMLAASAFGFLLYPWTSSRSRSQPTDLAERRDPLCLAGDKVCVPRTPGGSLLSPNLRCPPANTTAEYDILVSPEISRFSSLALPPR
jgi:hypothetical protein